MDQASVRALVDHCPAGIALFDLRGTRIECNDRFAEILQAGRDELLPGSEWLALLPSSWRSRGARGWNKIKDTATFADHEAVIRAVKGTPPRTLAVSGRISEKYPGGNLMFIVAVEDVTALKSRMDRLRSAAARTRSRHRSLLGRFEQTNDKLDASRIEVRRLQDALKKVNEATRILMVDFQEQKNAIEERIITNVQINVLPLLAELRATNLTPSQHHLVETLDFTFRHITSYFGIDLGKPKPRLSCREIDICRMISDGKRSREIASATGLAYQTVIVHRKNIRRKLGIKKTKQNLASFIRHNL